MFKSLPRLNDSIFNWFGFQSTQVLKIHFSEMSYLENRATSAELAVSIAFGLDPFLCSALRHCHPCLCPPTAFMDHVIGLSQAENKRDVQLMTLSTASALFLAHCLCPVAQLEANQIAGCALPICLVHQVLLLEPNVCVLSDKPSNGARSM